MLIAVGGMSGTGKTTLAVKLAAALPNTVHLDSDRTRKELFGISETTRLPPEAYTVEASEKLLAEMDRRASEFLKQGKTVVVSSTFFADGAADRQKNIADKAGVAFAGILLEADIQTLFDRVAKRVNDASDAGVDVVKLQSQKQASFPSSWIRVNSGQKPEDVLAEALKAIADIRCDTRTKPNSLRP